MLAKSLLFFTVLLAIDACSSEIEPIDSGLQRSAVHQAGHALLCNAYPKACNMGAAKIGPGIEDAVYDVKMDDSEDELHLALKLTQAGSASEEIYALAPIWTDSDDIGARIIAERLVEFHPEMTVESLIAHAREEAKTELGAKWQDLFKTTNQLLTNYYRQ